MPPEFDFDPSNSSLRIGIELEYPKMNERKDEKYISRGRETYGLNDSLTDVPVPHGGGRCVYDGTVGAEIVSNPLHLEDAPSWVADVVDYIEDEYGALYQPVGLMTRGSTAGKHLHLSPLTEEQAHDLYEISQTPWAKVLFCSSIANSDDAATWPVFRGGSHCRMNFNGSRYACVNQRGPDHYEWRLPEPMTPDHMEVVVTFLRLFEQEVDAAVQYAQEILDSGDERLTSIKRAEAAGMDIEEMPSIRREPAEADPENFYQTVEESWSLPEIYRVRMTGDDYYVFETGMIGEFSAEGVTFRNDDVLWADSLEPVTDPALADDVRRAFSRRDTFTQRETEATEELKEIIKKKKGKA